MGGGRRDLMFDVKLRKGHRYRIPILQTTVILWMQNSVEIRSILIVLVLRYQVNAHADLKP